MQMRTIQISKSAHFCHLCERASQNLSPDNLLMKMG